MKFGLKSIIVLAAIGLAIVSAILVGADTLQHALYVADAAIAVLAVAHFATDA